MYLELGLVTKKSGVKHKSTCCYLSPRFIYIFNADVFAETNLNKDKLVVNKIQFYCRLKVDKYFYTVHLLIRGYHGTLMFRGVRKYQCAEIS